MRTPTIYDAIKDAERLSDVARFGFSASIWRHFERLDGLPRGLLPLGDSFCRFNPIYGQGMSVAAQEACLLRRLLAERAEAEGDPLAGFAEEFLAAAAAVIETPWATAAVPDLIHPQTRGLRPPGFDDMVRFGGALTRLAARDPAVHDLMLQVRNLLKPYSAYRDPALVKRVNAVMAEGQNELLTAIAPLAAHREHFSGRIS